MPVMSLLIKKESDEIFTDIKAEQKSLNLVSRNGATTEYGQINTPTE